MNPGLAVIGNLDQLLERHAVAYWLFGGWAVDFHVGRITREHADIDIAAWHRDAARLHALLLAHGWVHAPDAGEDGYTAYQLSDTRLEVAFIARDESGSEYTPLRNGRGEWPAGSFGDDRLTLLGVTANVVARRALIEDKSTVRDDPAVTAKDRLDIESLR